MRIRVTLKHSFFILIVISSLLLGGCALDSMDQINPKSTKGVSIDRSKASENEDVEAKAIKGLGKEDAEAKVIDDPRKEGYSVTEETDSKSPDEDFAMGMDEYIAYFEKKYADILPDFWGEDIEGLVGGIDTADKVAALTFDACGGKGDGYDKKIIDFLIDEKIPATLFINSRWIHKNMDEFLELAANPLFEIANHGYHHKPLSVTGNSAYGIKGTQNIREVVEEILLNDEEILRLTGEKPKYFRSGTAYYDEVAVKIANELEYKVVNYSVLGDAGATYSKKQILKACSNVSPGSIIIFHMNRPEKGIAEGIIEGIKLLKGGGYTFVKLSEYDDFLR